MRVSGRVSLLRRGRLLVLRSLVRELGQAKQREEVRSQLRVVPAEVVRLRAGTFERGRVLGREIDVLASVDIRAAEPTRLLRVEELRDEHHHGSSGKVIGLARLAQEDRPATVLVSRFDGRLDLSVLVQLRQEQQELFSGH